MPQTPAPSNPATPLRQLRRFASVAAAASAFSLAVPALAAPRPAQSVDSQLPNIILIVADDLGYNDIGANGGAIPTPNIDALARSGIRFEAAYATAPICSPSRAGMLSGRAQTRFGFHFNLTGRHDIGMPAGETTLAEVAKSAGYQTALVGKWHVGDGPGRHPLEQGFDQFYGLMDGATSYFPDDAKGIVRSPEGQGLLITRARFPITDGRKTVAPKGNLTDVFTDRAIDFVAKHRQQPFFLYLAYNAPHTPLQATEEELAPFAHIEPLQNRIYHAMVARLDAGVGRVVDAVERLGLRQKTIIFFLSDNGCPNYLNWRGACSNAPFSGYKFYPLEGGNRIPFALSAPGRVPAGATSQAPVSTLDIMPTMAAAMNVPAPKSAEGIDLLSAARDRNPRALFWRMGPNYWVRQGAWKLISINRAARAETLEDAAGTPRAQLPLIPDSSPLGQVKLLFNLDADPAEAHNVAAAHPEVIRRLEGIYHDWNQRNEAPEFLSKRDFRTTIDDNVVQLIF